MEIIELMSKDNKEKYLQQLLECDWCAGKILAKMIILGKLEEMCKDNPRVFLLVNNDEVVSFCTYVHARRDAFEWRGEHKA